MSGSFFKELRRRNVFRVAAIYIVISWLLMQIGDVMFPALRLPEWSTTFLVAFLLLGLPVALFFAWAFELTPDGVVRTEDVPPDQSIASTTGQKINYMIIGVLALSVAFLLAKDMLLPDAEPVVTAGVTDQSIAILPFKNQSASEENAEFFAGGLHDELLTLLSRIGDLKVISRTSVERLDANLSIPEIGTLLGVATVLEGQVQRAGNRLRINVQLIDTAEEGHLWANTYDSELTAENIFEVQGDIARTIADALQAELSPDDEKLLKTVATKNLAAFEKYLMGTQIAKRGSFTALEEGAAYLVEATTLDPDFAQAWTALSLVYSDQFATGAIDLDEYAPRAKQAAERALSLDPTSPTAYAALESLKLWTGDWAAAESAFQEALRRGPADTMISERYGSFLRRGGQVEMAVEILKRALVTDPLGTRLWLELGKAEMFAGRPEQTLLASERILEIDPSNVGGYVNNLQAYEWMGRFDEAIPWFIKLVAIDPDDYESWAHIALAFDDLGYVDVAERYIRHAEMLGPDEPAVLKCRVLLLLKRGENESAVDVARAAINAGLHDRWGSDQVFYRVLRGQALEGGDVQEMLDQYRTRWPGLFLAKPEFDPGNRYVALDAILLLQHASRHDEAATLASATQDWYDQHIPDGIYGWEYGIARAELLAVTGRTEDALAELRRAIDSGWRLDWQFFPVRPKSGFDQ